MSDVSTIEWTDSTWNPVTGCTKLSAGCDNCYAERFSERFRGVSGHPFQTGFDLTLRPERVKQPVNWRRSRMIFVNSMSDLFHENIPFEYIDRVFDTMEQANWHIYQVLTKRSSIMRNYINRRYRECPAPMHIWIGVSIESKKTLSRLRHLLAANATTKFVSFEPLLGPVGPVDLHGIDWAIVGGESGPRARPIEAGWIREIREQCRKSDTAFFFKQWGGRTPKAGGNHLDGQQWLEYPPLLLSFDLGEGQKIAAGSDSSTMEMYEEVGPWARDKLTLLEKYLNAYTTIMRKQSTWCAGYAYIDAFAGFGRNRVRGLGGHPGLFNTEIEEYINGSPRVALELKHPFSRYVFIEKASSRTKSLEQLVNQYPNRDIKIYHGDCNDYLDQLCNKPGVDWGRFRAVVFLDPYGSQVRWRTIEAIAKTGAIEVIINFPLGMCINRMLPRSGVVLDGSAKKLDTIFGTHEWYDVVYKRFTRSDLFGEDTITSKRPAKVLLVWYRKRLKGLFEFVSLPHEVKNTRGAPLYHLIHVGPNKKGHDIATDVLNSLSKR